jgi:monofunctional chorismate mutase
MDLTELRKEIDQIDGELVRLLCQRMAVSSKVADYKRASGSPIYHPAREQEILRRLAEKAGPELAEYIQAVYATIFEQSRNYQNKQING